MSVCHLELSSAITSVDTLRTIPVCYHPSHMITNTALWLADTVLGSPLIGQRTSQLLAEPETGWERWSEVVGAGPSLLTSDWSEAVGTLFWLADTELVSWGRGRTWAELSLRLWGRPRHGRDQAALNAVSTLPHIDIKLHLIDIDSDQIGILHPDISRCYPQL